MFCDMTLPKGTLETGQQNAARGSAESRLAI
jgi:hypothetical protein